MNDDILPITLRQPLCQNTSSSSDSSARNLLSEQKLENFYNLTKLKETKPFFSFKRILKKESNINNKSNKSTTLSTWEALFLKLKRHLPILEWLPRYKIKSFLVSDLIAGLTVGIMNIPQGMAYAMLVTLNPINGLYISFFPLLIYGIFGSSKHLAVGAIAIVSLLSGSVVDRVARENPIPTSINVTNASDLVPISQTDADYRVNIAATLALLVGLLQFLMGLSGLGFLSSYFSDTFISGYTSGSAVHVVVSQIKEIFGMENVTKFDGPFKVPRVYWCLN